MTDVNFQAIAEAVKARLDTAFANRTITPEVVIDQTFEPREAWISVNLSSIDAPPDAQPLTASLKQRLQVRFEIWCWRFAMTNTQAAELRDALVGDVELALMLDRTLNGTVNTSWLEGGRFNRAEDPQSLGRFFCGGEVVLVCDVMASNI